MSISERLAASLQGFIASDQLWLALVVTAVGGLVTAWTPCVYPLVPITIRYFGAGERKGRLRVLRRAAIYMQGMALFYAMLGFTAAMSHQVFGFLLTSAWVLVGIALFCALMGGSMLGLFTLQLPASLATRLSRVGGQSVGGTFAMGLVSGLIAAPCTGPVTLVILTLIASGGSPGIGFALMYAFGAGLGLPFLLLAFFSDNLTRLPKGGTWMELVKSALATAMFVVAIYYLGFVVPALGTLLAQVPAAGFMAMTLILVGVLFAALQLRLTGRAAAPVLKVTSILLLTLGVSVALFGGEPAAAEDAKVSTTLAWQGIDGIERARALGKPAMIDFTADWCAACKELEHKTYVDAAVQAEAARFVVIKVDATTIDDAIQALFDRYGILGLPAVVFIDSRGRVLSEPRVAGFVEPARFLELMRQVR